MRSLWRGILLISTVLIIPILPLILLGSSYEVQVTAWLEQELTSTQRFWLLTGVLASDIFLPIPSSAVSTYGGGILGTWPACWASFLGMSVGAIGGFALAKWLGTPFAIRMAGAEEMQRLEHVCEKFGAFALLITRALPILAEACVLLLGTAQLSWKRFLPPLLVSNFFIALTYAAFGEWGQGRNALPTAVVLSGVIPLIIALIARKLLSRQRQQLQQAETPSSSGMPLE